MRTISEMISDVRFATNENDTNRFPDAKLLKFFNDAQDQIEALINISNFENSPLDKFYTISTTGADSYTLPTDIYSWNSVSGVYFKDGYKIPKGYKGQNTTNGYYYIVGNKLYLIPKLNGVDIEVQYKPKLARLTTTADTPSLPSMCDAFMTSFVERKIQAINSSSDVSNSNVFTEEEKNIIIEIFSQNNDDTTEIMEVRDTHGYFEYY